MKEKKSLPPSSIHLHTSCITTQLHLDYINVLPVSQASLCTRQTHSPLSAVPGRALWRRVILWYCVRINIKSHYGCDGLQERKGWRKQGWKRDLGWWATVGRLHFPLFFLFWNTKNEREEKMRSGLWNLDDTWWYLGGWFIKRRTVLLNLPCETVEHTHTHASTHTGPSRDKPNRG